MSKYDVNGYMELLNESYKFIKYYDRKYNQHMSSTSYKTKLRYNLFCFSQITFALRERLETDNPRDKDKINTFFEKGRPPLSEVGIVTKLANEWKHKGGFSLRQHYSILKEIRPSVFTPSKVEQRLPQNHKYLGSDINLILIFKKCLMDIRKFCKSNNYI